MEEEQFKISTNNICVCVDENNKVSLYILNNQRTAVRTIDELEQKQGGQEVIDVTAEGIYQEKAKIENKYKEIINKMRRPRFLFRQKLNEIKQRGMDEVEKMLEKYRKALNSPKLDVYRSITAEYDWFEDKTYRDYYYGYMSLNENAPKAEYVILGEKQVNLLTLENCNIKLNKSIPSLTNIKQLRDLQKDLQQKLLDNIKSTKEREEARKQERQNDRKLEQKTEEYLNY